MAPRGGHRKQTCRGPRKRQLTHFPELDTTPTSNHFQSSEEAVINASLAKPKSQKGDSSSKAHVPRSSGRSEQFGSSLDDQDLMSLDSLLGLDGAHNQTTGLALSEVASTRRSSPVNSPTPNDLWQFEAEAEAESIPAISSPRSGFDLLPDTVPIPSQGMPRSPQCIPMKPSSRVDFSETASTGQRSSPFNEEAAALDWELQTPGRHFESMALEHNDDTDHGQYEMPGSSSPIHLPTEELYDATPQKEILQDKSAGSNTLPDKEYPDTLRFLQLSEFPDFEPLPGERRRQSRLDFESEKDFVPSPPKTVKDEDTQTGIQEAAKTRQKTKNSRTAAIKTAKNQSIANLPPPSVTQSENLRGKKRKQQPKSPVKFDESTQEVKEGLDSKRKHPSARMPIVSALKNSSQPSSSPVAVPSAVPAKRKPANTTQQPKKKRKITPPKQDAKAPVTKKKPKMDDTPVVDSALKKKPATASATASSEPLNVIDKPSSVPQRKGNVTGPVTRGQKRASAPVFLGIISSDDDSDSLSSPYLPDQSTTKSTALLLKKADNKSHMSKPKASLSPSTGGNSQWLQNNEDAPQLGDLSNIEPMDQDEGYVKSASRAIEIERVEESPKPCTQSRQPRSIEEDDPYRLISSKPPSPKGHDLIMKATSTAEVHNQKSPIPQSRTSKVTKADNLTIVIPSSCTDPETSISAHQITTRSMAKDQKTSDKQSLPLVARKDTSRILSTRDTNVCAQPPQRQQAKERIQQIKDNDAPWSQQSKKSVQKKAKHSAADAGQDDPITHVKPKPVILRLASEEKESVNMSKQRPVPRGRQRANDPKRTRTLSISETGSPVRLQPQRRQKDNVSPSRQKDQHASSMHLASNHEEDNALLATVEKVSDMSPVQLSSPTLPEFKHLRQPQRASHELYKPSILHPNKRHLVAEKLHDVEKCQQKINKQDGAAKRHPDGRRTSHVAPPSFKLSGIREKIQADMTASFQEKEPADHSSENQAKIRSSNSSSPPYPENGSGIPKQLHNIVKVRIIICLSRILMANMLSDDESAPGEG